MAGKKVGHKVCVPFVNYDCTTALSSEQVLTFNSHTHSQMQTFNMWFWKGYRVVLTADLLMLLHD